MYKGTLSGVLFALIVKKFSTVKFVADKYKVWLAQVMIYQRITVIMKQNEYSTSRYPQFFEKIFEGVFQSLNKVSNV